MSELSLVQQSTDIQKEKKQRIKKEIKSVHIGYSDTAIEIKGIQF